MRRCDLKGFLIVSINPDLAANPHCAHANSAFRRGYALLEPGTYPIDIQLDYIPQVLPCGDDAPNERCDLHYPDSELALRVDGDTVGTPEPRVLMLLAEGAAGAEFCGGKPILENKRFAARRATIQKGERRHGIRITALDLVCTYVRQ